MSCMKNNKHQGDDCCFSCCKDKEFITDKLCCGFTVAAGASWYHPTTIFTGSIATACDLFATGTIENCGTRDIVVVFKRGVNSYGENGKVIRTVKIPAGGCVTFAVAHFDAIQAFFPYYASVIEAEENAQENAPEIMPEGWYGYEQENAGKICIVQRFPVHG